MLPMQIRREITIDVYQKTVYFLQEYGIDLRYAFNWYIYGPYSKRLADDGFDISKTYENTKPLQFVKPEVEERFEEFLEFIEPIKNDPYNLELAASIHALLKMGLDKESIRHRIKTKQT